ncbi:MAG: bifunctional adenosylcobinamide kinase/adenosylcobinamide-phosphate guanylyltransferase [Pseudomonadales bacterium]|nr:bifunctional adenosylcobinamide kinase/adenosylcobinamide-phosphate guanylyltransferase [Pseudomonadales bacterium]
MSHCHLVDSHLVIGGARSGKSRFALRAAEKSAQISNSQNVFIATATAEDEEMTSRIRRHQEERSSKWLLVEEPKNLSGAIRSHDSEDSVILVDCLTLWLSNCLHQGCWSTERDRFFETLEHLKAKLFVVNNETGLGVVPMGQLSREFVDQNGFLNQRLAEVCKTVTFVVAGLPQRLKG